VPLCLKPGRRLGRHCGVQQVTHVDVRDVKPEEAAAAGELALPPATSVQGQWS
jgi:hypothetical protein